jgi:hypothetical protein
MAGLAVFAGCLQVILCLGGLSFARSTKTTGSNLELLFADLQKLEYARPTTVDRETALNTLQREKEIEHEFADHGAEGIAFLLEKLSAINAKENAVIHGPDDVDEGLQFQISELAAGRSLLVRYAICYMLSDMYSLADATEQASILRAIVRSYLPSTHGKDDAETMDGSLFRLGKDGIEGLLMLANPPSVFNRCHAASILKELASGAPLIDCKSQDVDRDRSIEAFKQWWRVNSSKVQWPKFPGYFDIPSRVPTEQQIRGR